LAQYCESFCLRAPREPRSTDAMCDVLCGVNAVRTNGEDASWSAYAFAVWNLIIRPPRARYSQEELVARCPCQRLRAAGHQVRRSDFVVTNTRSNALVCTIFEPEGRREMGGASPARACVIYCHGNSDCRLAGFDLALIFLPLNISVACFDASGSGMSGGEFVTLGWHERDDLGVVIEHLRGERGFSRIGLWGFSMGASTVLMHAARDPSIAGVVADSPFGDLRQLIQEICWDYLRLPALAIDAILPGIRLIIQQKADFDIYEVSSSKHAPSSFVPALFLHGEADAFVAPSHSEFIARRYAGESQRIVVPNATHTSRRPKEYLHRAAVFLVRALRWERYVPRAVTEEVLGALAAGEFSGRTEAPTVGLAPDRQSSAALHEEAQVAGLLASQDPADRCLGLVRAACQLCGAYRGAQFLSNVSPNDACKGPSGPWYRTARHHARFAGHVFFPTDHAEIALCWVRRTPRGASTSYVAAGASRNDIDKADAALVDFALLSPTAICLTSVVLLPSRVARSAAHGGRDYAGLSCAEVLPLAFRSAELASGHPHDVALSIVEGGATLSAGGETVAFAACGCSGDVHLWCVEWNSTGADLGSTAGDDQLGIPAVRLELDTSSELEPLPVAPPLSGERAVVERLASNLATLCLGTNSTIGASGSGTMAASRVDRWHWRSHMLEVL